MRNKLRAGRICATCKKNEASEYTSYCKPCRSKRQGLYDKKDGYARIKRRIAKLREMVKTAKAKPCADCKIEYPWYVMDFDHVRGKKEFDISRAATMRCSLVRIEEEVAKCEVVCANCHRSRTFSRNDICRGGEA